MAKEVTGFPNEILSKGDIAECTQALKEFNDRNAGAFVFGPSTVKERQEFTVHLLNLAGRCATGTPQLEELDACLAALVVMSRDTSSVTGKFVSRETWTHLLKLAGIIKHGGEASTPLNEQIMTHASKCLCNIIFITKDSKGLCSDDEFLQGLVTRLKDFSESPPTNDLVLEFLTLRFLFLASILNIDARMKLIENYEGRRLFLDYMSVKLKFCKSTESRTPCIRGNLSAGHANSCCEILKTLFNLNIKAHNEETQVREEKIMLEFSDLISICRKCLLLQVEEDETLTAKLHSDAGNCMYSVPSSCLNEDQFIPLIPQEEIKGDLFSYSGSDVPNMEDRDVSVVSNILDSVEKKIKENQLSTDTLQPVLALLSHLSRTSRFIRKYCKQRIIPPRKDFEHRPEVGPEFSNKLIKLFTNANTEVKAAAADFVFVMCKEKVDRLVKYTGYGNSAGLLASRGLLAGGRGDTIYSDTDSDSDTEEYLENVDKINPVTGHVPPEVPNPMEGMTDEQKEYLAVKLANQLAELSTSEVFAPVCVDEKTGKLIPFRQKVHETVVEEEKGSDSDDSD